MQDKLIIQNNNLCITENKNYFKKKAYYVKKSLYKFKKLYFKKGGKAKNLLAF